MTGRVGSLRHGVTLEEPVRVADDAGGANLTWREVATLWADIRARTGKETLEADRLSGRVSVDIFIRYRTGVVPAMRFRHGERIFHIRAVLDEDGRRRWLKCLCEERDS